METPRFGLRQFVNVYSPGEDTFLLLDALELDSDAIIGLKPNLIAEIGCGNGVVISALALLLNKSAACIATDVNFEACLATNHTASLNGVKVDCCSMNLLCGFRQGVFDLIVFNPPYVPTDTSETKGDGLARSWAGGQDGREIIDEFLPLLPSMLSSDGVCYLLVLKENGPCEIQRILEGLGLESVVLKERKIPGEHLFVLKICRAKGTGRISFVRRQLGSKQTKNVSRCSVPNSTVFEA